MRDSVLWRKMSRIIIQMANLFKISPEQALNLYYSTNVYKQMVDPKYGLQLRSDGYIMEEIINELRDKHIE